MINVRRIDQPKILSQKARAWTQKLLAAQTEKDRSNAQKKYRHRNIKDDLVRMFRSKCAYCESKITHVDYGHIDHYRPKSKFPDLTFEWSNLLLACGIFNGTKYKGEQFPEVDEGGPLINPCDDDPNDHFNFFYDPVARIASVYGTTDRGETTERLLGLNRHDLRDYRSRFVRKLHVLARFAVNDPEAKDLLEDAQKNNAEYAAFTRQITP